MSRIIRISLIIAGLAVLAAVIIGTVWLAVTVRRPFPTTAGSLSVPGLQDEVHIYRDEWGIPHIYAQNEHDLFFAQGYVHAQDRFWQMEFWRHVGQGRISEIAGEATLDSDKFIRTMGWNRLAQQTLTYIEEESPEYSAILTSYSAGVNAYIDANRDSLSLNQTILGLVNEPWEIEPWTPLNTLTWGMVMANDLSGNWNDELRRAQLINEMGEATVASLLPPYPHGERPVIVPTEAMDNELPEAETSLNLDTAVDWSRVNTDIIGAVPENGFALGGGAAVGSNSWAVNGDHTATGMPLLANDPHLGIQMPSIWYEVGLHAPGWNVAGFSFAGVPGVIIGHNEHIAWGFTNVGPDVQDLYIEKINPSNPLQYEFMGEWQDMDVIEEVIKINGAEDVVLEVRLTQHGPIINEVIDGQSDVLAMKWTAQEPTRVFLSITLLNQAENYDDFREALRFFDVPAQNVVYADVEGNIAYQMPGRIPIRQNGDGLVPVPGWTGEYEWEDWIPYEQLPAVLNPEQGYIVTANNAVVDPEYPYLIARDWNNGDRAQRITELIEEAIDSGNVSADTFARIQFDNHSLLAADYIPLFAGLSSDDNQVQAAIERLRGWDLREHRDSVPAALFEIFFTHLIDNVLADEVGEDNVLDAANIIFFHDLAGQPDARWWDDARTDGRETREDILLRALTDAIDWFEENVGGDMNDWTWGSIHTATFVSAPLGQSGVGPIESVVNRGPFPADGGQHIVNANSWDRSDPAAVTGHPSMRMIVDMSDFDASRGIHSTGQSGHPFHQHYDDMIELWLNGEYHSWHFSQEAVEAAAVNHLVLQPGE